MNLSLFVKRAEEERRLTALVAEIALEQGCDPEDRPHRTKIADAAQLRDIPAIGPRAAASAIKGSQPGKGKLFE